MRKLIPKPLAVEMQQRNTLNFSCRDAANLYLKLLSCRDATMIGLTGGKIPLGYPRPSVRLINQLPSTLPIWETGVLILSTLGDFCDTPLVSKAAPSTSYVSREDTG